MIQNQCLTLSSEANAFAKKQSARHKGFGRLGFRFEHNSSGKHTFVPVNELRVKDYVLQPVLGGVVVFVDPHSFEKAYGTDIHLDKDTFVFVQSNRTMPKVVTKTEQKRAEERERRKATRSTKAASWDATDHQEQPALSASVSKTTKKPSKKKTTT